MNFKIVYYDTPLRTFVTGTVRVFRASAMHYWQAATFSPFQLYRVGGENWSDIVLFW